MRVRKITFLVTLLFHLSLSGSCFAESLILDEITVRGQEESPQQETLTIREVRESAARDMGEALLLVPGIINVHKGAIANDIVLRGLQRDNINVFLDGVRLYGGCPSRMDPPSFHFDFAEVDSVEIIKGPYDLYNPGSMGGLVNALSKVAPPGASATLTATYGSYSLVNLSASGSYAVDDTSILGGYAYKSSDVPESGDGKLLTDIYPATSMNRYKPEFLDSDAYEINTFWIKGGVALGPSKFSLNYSYQDAENVLYPYLLMDAEYDRTHRINFTSKTKLTGSAIDEVNFQAWWNSVDHLMNDMFRVSSTPSMMVTQDVMMETDSTTFVYGAKLNASTGLAAGTLEAGVDYYTRNWDATNISAMWMMYAPQPMLPDVDSDNIGGFAKYNRNLGEKFKISGGVRIDFTEVEANALTQARLTSLYQPYHTATLSTQTDFTELSGNLQLSWFPTDGIEVFTGLGSGARPPDAQELYIGLQRPSMSVNWIGNPDLDATRNNQVDLGVKFSGDGYYLNTSIFYSSLEDFIYLDDRADPDGMMGPLAPARTFQNIDADMYGGEIAGQYALPLDLYLRGSLSYVRGEDSDTDTPLIEIPPLTGSIGLRYDIGDFFFEVSERFADGQDRVDTTLNEEETAGWGVTDLKSGVNWNKWSVTGGVNNLFDKHYFTHLSYKRDPFGSGVKVPETGMLAYLTLAYRY